MIFIYLTINIQKNINITQHLEVYKGNAYFFKKSVPTNLWKEKRIRKVDNCVQVQKKNTNYNNNKKKKNIIKLQNIID